MTVNVDDAADGVGVDAVSVRHPCYEMASLLEDDGNQHHLCYVICAVKRKINGHE